MQFNGIKCISYEVNGNELAIVAEGNVNDVLSVTSNHISFVTDEGDLVEEFFGYIKKSATYDVITGRVTLLCALDTDGHGATIAALGEALASEKAKNADLQAQVEEQAAAIEELAAIIAEMEA